MAISGGSTIINDPSLQLMVDPLNVKSYPGTGTAFYDISTAPWTFTLQNSPTFNSSGYFTYNGTTQYASSGNASVGNTVTFFTSTGYSTWTVPTNLTVPYTIHGIAGGAGGGAAGGRGGGGAGAYAMVNDTNVNLSPSSTVYLFVGTGGAAGSAGDNTWVNTSGVNAAPATSTAGLFAERGTSTAGTGAGVGGRSSFSVGFRRYSGGSGGTGGGATERDAGGGGAAGPGGVGGTGGTGGSASTYRGGGGGGAGLSAAGAAGVAGGSITSGDGGDNGEAYGYGNAAIGSGNAATFGTSGGGGGGGFAGTTPGFNAGAGGAGDIWFSTISNTYAGPGGGGGGGRSATARGGIYGGAGGSGTTGGAGAQGIAVIEYRQSNTIPATALSVCAWVNQTTAGTVDTIISHSSATGTNNGWSLGISAAGKLQFVLNGVATYASTLASISTSTWTHVAATVSGTALTFYLNGVAQDTATIGSMSGTPLVMVIGSDPSNNYFNGSIGPITINNRQLSAIEIAQNFNAARGRYGV